MRCVARVGLVSIVLSLFAAGCAVEQGDGDATSVAPLTAPGDAAKSALEKSRARRDELSAGLARQMSQIGAALTAEQQSAYVRAFTALPEVSQTTTDFERASADLDRELRTVMADPSTLASVLRSPFDDGGMYDAAKMLADTRYAGTALVFASHLLGDDPAYANARRPTDQVVRDLVSPALPSAFAALLLTTGSTTSALEQLRVLLAAAKGQCSAAIAWIESYRDFSGAYDENPDLVHIKDQPVGKALRAVGALLSFWQVADGATELLRGNARAALEKLVKGGPDSVAALAQATGAVRRILLGVEKTPFADKVIKVAGKIGAAFGIIAGILETLDDLERWDASDDAKLHVLGDVVSVGAAALALVGVATGGAVLGIVALGITLLADFLEDQRHAHDDLSEKQACLAAVFPNDADLARTLALADPASVRTFSDDFWMTPDAIQRTARVYPDAFTHQKRQPFATEWVGLLVMKDIFVLSGAEVATLLEKVAGGETNPDVRDYKIRFFTSYLSVAPGWDPEMLQGQAGALDWLRQQEQSETFQILQWALGDAAWEKIVGDVTAYVQSVQYEGPH